MPSSLPLADLHGQRFLQGFEDAFVGGIDFGAFHGALRIAVAKAISDGFGSCGDFITFIEIE